MVQEMPSGACDGCVSDLVAAAASCGEEAEEKGAQALAGHALDGALSSK